MILRNTACQIERHTGLPPHRVRPSFSENEHNSSKCSAGLELGGTDGLSIQGSKTQFKEGPYTLVRNNPLWWTWADAYWTVDFYRKRGFALLPDKDRLLKAYWDISQRQIETSVVLGHNE